MIIEVNSRRLFYVEEGNINDPVMFYIHGNLGSSLWFKKVMKINGYKTIALDLPNFANSESIDKMDIESYADYAEKVLKKILKNFYKKNAVLVGHSLGAAVAVSLAVRNPGMISSLILIDPPPLEGLVTPNEHYPYIEKYRTDKQLLKAALKTVAPGLDNDDFLNDLTEDAFRMKDEAFIEHAKSLESFNCSGEVADFTQAVLVIVGEKDILISKEMGQNVSDSFPNGEYRYVRDVGHSIIVEAPEMFIKMVENFLTAQK